MEDEPLPERAPRRRRPTAGAGNYRKIEVSKIARIHHRSLQNTIADIYEPFLNDTDRKTCFFRHLDYSRFSSSRWWISGEEDSWSATRAIHNVSHFDLSFKGKWSYAIKIKTKMHQNDLLLAPRKCFCLCDLLILPEKNVKAGAYYKKYHKVNENLWFTNFFSLYRQKLLIERDIFLFQKWNLHVWKDLLQHFSY